MPAPSPARPSPASEQAHLNSQPLESPTGPWDQTLSAAPTSVHAHLSHSLGEGVLFPSDVTPTPTEARADTHLPFHPPPCPNPMGALTVLNDDFDEPDRASPCLGKEFLQLLCGYKNKKHGGG